MSDVRIVEVGPRDGLQNEAVHLSVDQRIELVHRLAQCGLTTIEVGAMVSPAWVPQMQGSDEVLNRLSAEPQTQAAYCVLVPNVTGFQAAKKSGARQVAVFSAASETFSQKNTNCSIAESLARCQAVIHEAQQADIAVRGYVSCATFCPYEGEIPMRKTVDVAEQLLASGCYEVSLGDTVGRATPKSLRALLQALTQAVPVEKLAFHGHDTYGLAIANVQTALECGIRVFDASVGGAGGCPYADGAAGNVATEDLVYLLEEQGMLTGVNLHQLADTGRWLFEMLGKVSPSKVNNVLVNSVLVNSALRSG